METITLSKKLNIKKSYDVIVCGGGVAGVAAAVTAANNGNSVLIIEKSNILGGLATLGLVNLFVMMLAKYKVAEEAFFKSISGLAYGKYEFILKQFNNKNECIVETNKINFSLKSATFSKVVESSKVNNKE